MRLFLDRIDPDWKKKKSIDRIKTTNKQRINKNKSTDSNQQQSINNQSADDLFHFIDWNDSFEATNQSKKRKQSSNQPSNQSMNQSTNQSTDRSISTRSSSSSSSAFNKSPVKSPSINRRSQSMYQSINQCLLIQLEDSIPFELALNQQEIDSMTVNELKQKLIEFIEQSTGISIKSIGRLFVANNSFSINGLSSIKSIINQSNQSIPIIQLSNLSFEPIVSSMIDCFDRFCSLNQRVERNKFIAHSIQCINRSKQFFVSMNQFNIQTKHLLPFFASLRFERGLIEEMRIERIESIGSNSNAYQTDRIDEEEQCIESITQSITDSQRINPNCAKSFADFLAFIDQRAARSAVSLPRSAINEGEASFPLARLKLVSFANCINVSSSCWPTLVASLNLLPALQSIDLRDASIDEGSLDSLAFLCSNSSSLKCLRIGRWIVGGIRAWDESFQGAFERFIDAASSMQELDLAGHEWNLEQVAKILQSCTKSFTIERLDLSRIPCLIELEKTEFLAALLPRLFTVYTALGELLIHSKLSSLCLDSWADHGEMLGHILSWALARPQCVLDPCRGERAR